MVPRQQEVGDGADGIQIGAAIDGVGLGDGLGRHVERRAGDRVGCRRLDEVPTEVLHEAEVDYLDDVGLVGSLGENDVRGLDVAVDQAERMRLGERAADLREDVDRARGLDGP